MDAMGVDIQVVYPTLFLAYVTDDVGLEVALCLVVGSDWGHHGGRGRGGDPSGQPEVFAHMRSRGDVGSTVGAKLLSDNARKLYSLPRSGL